MKHHNDDDNILSPVRYILMKLNILSHQKTKIRLSNKQSVFMTKSGKMKLPYYRKLTDSSDFFFLYTFFISGTEHPREDNPDLYYWAEITGQHTQTLLN